MAKALVWHDLSEDQVTRIVDECGSPQEIRRYLKNYLNLEDGVEFQSEIMLDMYFNAFIFTQDRRFTAEKVSAFISILKDVHKHVVDEQLTPEKSWEKSKSLLLLHSVQRPPFSIQVFSWADLQAITNYLLNTYYRHYKLYQYAFSPTFILDIETFADDIELMPPIPSLNDAINQQEWDAKQDALRKQKEEEEAKLLAEQALAEEAAEKARIEAAFRDAVPETIADKAKALVDYYIQEMKSELSNMLQDQEKKLCEKFTALQSRVKSK